MTSLPRARALGVKALRGCTGRVAGAPDYANMAWGMAGEKGVVHLARGFPDGRLGLVDSCFRFVLAGRITLRAIYRQLFFCSYMRVT